jgi:hypothetical protein
VYLPIDVCKVLNTQVRVSESGQDPTFTAIGHFVDISFIRGRRDRCWIHHDHVLAEEREIVMDWKPKITVLQGESEWWCLVLILRCDSEKQVTGSFTSKTAGGNCTYPSFMINPQYRLCLHPTNLKSERAKLALTLQVGKDVPVNVAMVWSQGQRISEWVPISRACVFK